MHLCYLLPPIEFYSPQSGGAIATMTMQQGRRLQAQGIRVSVLAAHENEPVYDVGEFHALSGVTRNGLNPLQRGFSSKIRRPLAKSDWLYYEHYRARAQEILRKIQPDAILCFNDWQTPLFAKQTVPNARVFLRLSNECRTKMPSIAPTMQAVERVFALSGFIQNWTTQHFGLSDEKFTLLPNGADLTSFSPAENTFERVLDPKNPLRALFISRINPDKGPDIAADAVAQARKNGENVELTMAGAHWFYEHGDEKNAFVQQVKAKADAAGAQYLGHVARDLVPDLFRGHDVLLFPIRWNEPMSQVVFEAMASGCAVLSSPLGGVPEACGDAALWAKAGDVSEFAAHLTALNQNRAQLVEQKQKGLARAQEMTWDRNAQIFAQILRNPIEKL